MPIPSPFHPRTHPLCESYRWKDWAGYHAVCRYRHSHEPEYYAFRQSVGMIDVSPLFKYDVQGPDAARLLSRMMVRDIGKLAVGRVTYVCWCDDDGKVIDDGTVTRLDEDRYRVTAAEPTFHWLVALSEGMKVAIEDTTVSIAALALQGPNSREVLAACVGDGVRELGFFRVAEAVIDGVDVWITRTGYTGDLGYEIWTARDDALALWDALVDVGVPYGLRACGLDALDMTRIEAGFVLAGIDYFSSHNVVVDFRKSTPFELGLGWMVDLDREPFLGQRALAVEKEAGSAWQLVGLEIDQDALEKLYEAQGLPAYVPAEACRDALPVYGDGQQAGQATSNTWSPILKRKIAIASMRTPYAKPGTRLEIEHTVEYERSKVACRVVKLPFFNPERKRT